MNDPFNLKRFVNAQDAVYEDVLSELRSGRKTGHWMWFIFPQLKGLGRSSTAREFGIASRGEARAYLAHPVLGPRLVECTRLVNLIENRAAEEIFGHIDTLKFRSSATLFAEVADDPAVFEEALRKYFDGHPDPLTLAGLK